MVYENVVLAPAVPGTEIAVAYAASLNAWTETEGKLMKM